MFGWSGWSLSAPHPARRPAFRYEGPQGDGPERTETLDEPADPPPNAANVTTHPKVAPGTLPRLRYGRSVRDAGVGRRSRRQQRAAS